MGIQYREIYTRRGALIQMKATPEELVLHQRLLMKDQLAAVELANLLYDPLVRSVRDRVDRTTDSDFVEDAVVEALMSYVDAPEKYNPQKSTLKGYLTMIAHRDVKNALSKEYRRSRLHISLSNPAVQENDIIDTTQNADVHLHEQAIEDVWERINELFPDPIDRKIADLILHQVRPPEPYIEAMSLGGLPRSEQLQRVRRAKDRISRHIRRKGGSIYGEI